MTAYNGNVVYLQIGTLVVSAMYKNVKYEPSVEVVDTTRGSGTEWTQANTGLKSAKISMVIGLEVEQEAAQLANLKPGKYMITFGTRGTTTGTPKHQQEFIVTDSPFEIDVEKKEVTFALKGESSAAPVIDIQNGGVW